MTVRSPVANIQLTVRGDISPDDRAYAVSKIQHTLHLTGRPVLKAHLVLGWETDPAHPHPARLGIGIDLNGTPIRAHVAADTVREGADLLQDRLRRRLVQLQERAQDRQRRAVPTPVADQAGPDELYEEAAHE